MGPTGSAPHPSGSNGPTGLSNKTVLLVGGAVAALVVLLAGGLFAFKSLTAPEELTVRKYAKQYCEAIEEPADDLSDAAEEYFEESEDLRDDEYEFTRVSDREAEDLKELAEVYLSAQAAFTNEVKGFSDSHRLKGNDGQDLHEDILEWAEAQLEEIDDAKSDLNDVDMEDPDDAAEDISKAVLFDQETIDDSDESAEIAQEAFEEDDECFFPTAYEGGE